MSTLLFFLFCLPVWLFAINGPNDKFIINNVVYAIGATRTEFENGVYPNQAVVVGVINGLKNITIPSTVFYNETTYTIVGVDFIRGNSYHIDSIFLSNSIKRIRRLAFPNEQCIKYINIPDSITKIDKYAFFNVGITSIFIPRNLTDIGINAFGHNLEFFHVDSANPSYTSEDGVLYDKSKSTLIAYPSGRKTDLFRIPNSVTHIAVGAFRYAKIGSLVIPYNVTDIGEEALQESEITSIIIPNSISRINSKIFFGCENLRNVIIPESVTSIGESAFFRCKNLESVILPNNIKLVEKYTFSHSGLTSIILPNNITSIGNEAFSNCSSLRSIIIPDSVTTIGEAAFLNCKSLTSVIIPNSTKIIEKYAFENCNLLDTIQGANNVTAVGFYAFHGTAWYKSQEDGMIYLGKTLYRYNGEMKKRMKITIPEGICSITESAFPNCTGFVKITLPESLEYIGCDVLGGFRNLKSINIPQNVKIICPVAFTNFCPVSFTNFLGIKKNYGLKKINVYWQDPSSVNEIYSRERLYAPKKCKLIIPKGTKEKYEQSETWKNFKIVERRR
jgi:hypothetical protein